MRTTFDQRVEPLGLTGAKWTVIAVVASQPGATQRTIASALDVTEVTAGRLIDRLCEAGHLERRLDPEDRRAYRIYLTKSAAPLLKQLAQVAAVCESEAFAGFSAADLKRLDGYLEKILQNIAKPRGKDVRATRAHEPKR